MGRRRILVVEDDVNARNALVELLTEAGYEVEAADGGGDALRRMDRFSPDVLLTDVTLPDMTGFVLADLTAARHARTDVLYMSSEPSPVSARWFEKPLDIEALLAALARLSLKSSA